MGKKCMTAILQMINWTLSLSRMATSIILTLSLVSKDFYNFLFLSFDFVTFNWDFPINWEKLGNTVQPNVYIMESGVINTYIVLCTMKNQTGNTFWIIVQTSYFFFCHNVSLYKMNPKVSSCGGTWVKWVTN